MTVPALKHVRGLFLDLMRGILQSDACICRGLYQRPYFDKLLEDPKAHFTRIGGQQALASRGAGMAVAGECGRPGRVR